MKKCFIVCPISSEGTETRKRSDDLFEYIITPVCEDLKYEPIRVDKINHTDKIDTKIVQYLEESELVIADVTEQNPNAFFELGYRIALKKPVIQMAMEETVLPFDIASTRTIFYQTNDLGKANRTKAALTSTMKELNDQMETMAQVANTVENSDSTGVEISSQILANLFELKSTILDLKESIKTNNNEVIETIMKTSYTAVQNSQPNPTDIALAETITQVMKDPKLLSAILQSQPSNQKTTSNNGANTSAYIEALKSIVDNQKK
ncbi:MAG: hypothetical protein ACC608_03915 [Anaerofustis sp.]